MFRYGVNRLNFQEVDKFLRRADSLIFLFLVKCSDLGSVPFYNLFPLTCWKSPALTDNDKLPIV
jgi:hypothetical protein